MSYNEKVSNYIYIYIYIYIYLSIVIKSIISKQYHGLSITFYDDSAFSINTKEIIVGLFINSG